MNNAERNLLAYCRAKAAMLDGISICLICISTVQSELPRTHLDELRDCG
jgi:hypothetical protein